MWLVLGGDGQLGRCLDEVLLAANIPHRCANRSTVDITDASAVGGIVADLSPAVIVNAAAWTAVDDAEDHESDALRINGGGAGNVARAARDCGARLIHISTDYVFNGRATSPYRIDSETAPVGAYGRTKLVGEQEVDKAGLDRWHVVRTAWLYSRHGRNFAKTMAIRALRGEAVSVVDDQRGQPTSALDLARMLVALHRADAPSGIVHGTNGGEATWYEFARAIYECADADTSLVGATNSGAYVTKAVRPAYSVLDHSGFADLGISPMRHWRDALADAWPAISDRVREESAT